MNVTELQEVNIMQWKESDTLSESKLYIAIGLHADFTEL